MAVSFGDSIRANSAKLLIDLNGKCYKIARDLFYTVVEQTPSPSNPGEYAKGYLADQWYPMEGSDFSGELDMRTSRDGKDSINRIMAMQQRNVFWGQDGSLTMANNLPYAYRAEVLGWPQPDWSGRVGPYRMVAMSIQAIATKYS